MSADGLAEKVVNHVGYAVGTNVDGSLDWTAVSDQPPAQAVWSPAAIRSESVQALEAVRALLTVRSHAPKL